MDEDDWWWEWSGLAGGLWTAVVCLVVVLGSVVNLAVLAHWITSRPSQESPSAALPFTDLLMCMIAAPLRYAVHTPSSKILVKKGLFPTGSTYILENETYIYKTAENESAVMSLDNENLSFYEKDSNKENNYTEIGNDVQVIKVSIDVIHIIIVFICLASLHVVVMVAVHHLALLFRYSSNFTFSVNHSSPIIVLIGALVTSGMLVAILHAVGHFTAELPLLGMVQDINEFSSPPTAAVGFLSYVAGLCSITVFCYGAIIAAILYQGRDRSVTNVPSRQNLQSSSCSGVSNNFSNTEEDGNVQIYNGQGKSLRACMTVVSVLITLTVCWIIPVSLALYALLNAAHMTSALPYSDVLLLLSGLIHPFVYGEGWMAMANCFGAIGHAVSTVVYRIGITKLRKAFSTSTEMRDQDYQREQRCCCPCRTSASQNANLFSEVSIIVNNFPLRNALSHNDQDYL